MVKTRKLEIKSIENEEIIMAMTMIYLNIYLYVRTLNIMLL